MIEKPSQLPRLKPGSWISLDTEASGFYPDDGARVSVVSVAWNAADMMCVCELVKYGNGPDSTSCPVHDSYWVADDGVYGAAFPFAQGPEIQPWFGGAFTLFGGDEEINLPRFEWDELVWWIGLQHLHVAMHNAQYDLVMMGAGLPEWAPAGPVSWFMGDIVRWDTMLANKNIWPTELKALGPTATRLGLGTKLGDPVKAWIKKHKAEYVRQGYPAWAGGYDLVPWDLIMREYAAEDAVLTQKLLRVQQAMFADGYGDRVEFVTKQMPLMKQFVAMERRGLPFPRDLSLSQVGKLEAKQRATGKALPFTPTKAEAVRFFYTTEMSARGFEGLGLIPERFGKERKDGTAPISLDAEVLGDLTHENVPYAADWKLYTDLGRLASMYYLGYAEKTGTDGRLRARIRQLREETKASAGMADRFSIERVNLQAMPHDRKLVKATADLDMPTLREMIAWEVTENYPGWGLFEFDLSQAELRVGALLSNCTPMLEAFRAGEDLHRKTMDMLGITERTPAKMSNFLLIFDGGAPTFRVQAKRQAGLRLTAREAEEIVYGWKRAYPHFKRQTDRWERFAKKNHYVPLANGQLRWFLPREDYRKGWNQRVQGSIAQLFQEWLLATEEICQEVQPLAQHELGGSAGPLMTVHDSIICLLPLDAADAIGEEIKAAALTLWEDMFPGVPGDVDCKPFGKD
jgi:DNA polymerase I-like protein with 3'-5' exonuclease and polymerase domains